jgi:hypothetical protein
LLPPERPTSPVITESSATWARPAPPALDPQRDNLGRSSSLRRWHTLPSLTASLVSTGWCDSLLAPVFQQIEIEEYMEPGSGARLRIFGVTEVRRHCPAQTTTSVCRRLTLGVRL